MGEKKGFFSRLVEGLTKTRNNIVSGIDSVFHGFSKIDDEFYEELEEILIMGDLGVKATESILDDLREKVKANHVKEPAECKQLLIDSIKQQMQVGETAYRFEEETSVVLVIGVNGVGKTTTVGKLAGKLKEQGKKVVIAGADTFRAAAGDQLKEWADRSGVDMIGGTEGADPGSVVYDATAAAKARNADVLLVDTAGRLHNKKNLMNELGKINKILEKEYPQAYRETLVVLDATTGQNALVQAKEFSDVAKISGIVLTKMDGTAKGGIAVAIQAELGVPVKYIGVGETIDDLQKFDPDEFVNALFDVKIRRTTMKMLTLDKFEEASEKVKEVTLETKLVYSDYLSDQTGNKIYLKPENMQFTGAYKVRGAYYKISTLSEEERQRGLITASAGNHAQGVAYAAKCYGCKAVIVMPTTTPLIKVNRTKSYGAEVVLYGDVYDEACAHALELAEKNGYTFIHPFDDLAVATGQGTIAMEIFKELPLVEYILVPIGGGGLATGVSTLAKLLNPKIKVIGVEPAGANCMQASFAAGKVTTLPTVNTIADGTAVKTPGSKIFPYIQKNLDDIITVTDDELIVSFLDMVENHKMIVENSGLLTVAALKHLNVKDKRVVSILSGGNMDVITMSSVVQQGLIFRDRIFTVSVLLPDKPGELAKVSETLAKEQGNVIKLEHNQFVSTNRNAAVELRITLECFGTDHKKQIIKALEKAGYKPKIVRTMI